MSVNDGDLWRVLNLTEKIFDFNISFLRKNYIRLHDRQILKKNY